MEGCPAGDAGPVLNAGGAERPGFRLRHPSAKFCKCQQENVMLSRFLRRTETVEGDGFNSQPLGRVVSVTETNWTSIPSDVPSPARVYYTGEWLL
jgi:hypothetical protein